MFELDPLIPSQNEMAIIKANILRGDKSEVARLLRGLAFHGAKRIGKTDQEAKEMALNPVLADAQIMVVVK